MKERIMAALQAAYAEFAEEQIQIVKSARKQDSDASRTITIMLDEFLMVALSRDPNAFPPEIHKVENSGLQDAFAKYDINAEELLEKMEKWTKQLKSYKKRGIEGVCVTTSKSNPSKNRIFFQLM